MFEKNDSQETKKLNVEAKKAKDNKANAIECKQTLVQLQAHINFCRTHSLEPAHVQSSLHGGKCSQVHSDIKRPNDSEIRNDS